MNKEDLILERLDRIEHQLLPIVQTAGSIKELKDDLMPLSSQAIRLVTKELEEVESSFQLEDLLILTKRMLRSTKNISFALEQLESIVDFVTTIEPLLRSSVPQIIHYLDDLEQKGVLRVLQSMLDVRAKIAANYTAEDMEQIGDGVVAMLGLAKKFSDPHALAVMEKMADMPGKIDLTQCKDTGPFGLLSRCASRDVKKGLGVLMELTRAMGTLKEDSDGEILPLESDESLKQQSPARLS
jgi:uncharacterized protein YjgD (DUF1641 family)